VDSRSIIRNYFVISGSYNLAASLIWGINTLFLLDAGLTIFEVFLVNAIFSAGMAVFEIPTGVLADTSGRRLSFLLSVAVLALGTLGYVGTAVFGGGLLPFIVMSIILGLGYTFYSGAVEAWLVDALKATGFNGSFDQVFARSNLVTGAAMLVGTVGGGILGDIDLAVPFLLRAALMTFLLIFAYFTMHDIGYRPRTLSLSAFPTEMKSVAVSSLRLGWEQPSLRLLMFANILQAGFLYWGFYAWQPYFLELLGGSRVWVAGVVAALISLSTMVGNGFVDWFSRYCEKRTTLLLWASLCGSLAAIGVGLAGSFWVAVSLLLVYMAAVGVITPVRQALIHQLIPSDTRAAIVSLDSLVASSGGILGQTGLGYISQRGSIARGFVIGGIATLTAFPLYGLLRLLRHPADRLAGKTGASSACAAQGIPSISSVNTTTGGELSEMDRKDA
jgi:MFS family permease